MKKENPQFVSGRQASLDTKAKKQERLKEEQNGCKGTETSEYTMA